MASCQTSVKATEVLPTASLQPYLFPTSTATRTLVTPTVFPLPTLVSLPTPLVHVVEENETLLAIAARYGIGLEDLLAANPGIDPESLPIGASLIIPLPAEGEDAWILPTSTPVPVELSQVNCFSQTLGGLWCILGARSGSDLAVESLAVMIALVDAQGNPLASAIAYSPLDRIPAKATVPVAALFAAPDSDTYQAQASIVRAMAAEEGKGRYIELDMKLTANQPCELGQSWCIAGETGVPRESSIPASRMAILATAYSEGNEPIGYAKWVSEDQLNPGHSTHFELRVFSLGPEISHIEVISEGIAAP